ncbi:hypothetical protein DSO57_1033346 [Entomophthora muscae]|uniref:Uncharacterized protein n=1 Tax=Entomophthora muscae TaxID=34485 RepID=A0ACC2RR35_9FUNG|nr:hypothetical protein DSO57_1033346 [Entomophthora muscae]
MPKGTPRSFTMIACAPAVPSPHKGCLHGPSQTFPRLQSWCLTTSRGQGGVATEFLDSPANVSYDTQEALDESPLDVSNVVVISGLHKAYETGTPVGVEPNPVVLGLVDY